MQVNAFKPLNSQMKASEMLGNFIDQQIASNNVAVDFSDSIANLNANDFCLETNPNRLDLRAKPCITIDCTDTQDMDDACSLEKTSWGFRLGVHIADVSSYVQPGSMLDEAAYNRGTSIYLPGKTIPMLPAILTNNLCSLVADEDRRSVSVLIDLDDKGNVKGYTIHKALIRSKLKGVYDEVDAIFDGTAEPALVRKYQSITPMLWDMYALAQKLRFLRIEQGARVSDDKKPIIVVKGGSIEVRKPQVGWAERIVEEFMILCNKLVGDYMEQQHLPCIFRTQANRNVYAQYDTESKQHASLGIHSYVHFTSPIRRLADLKVHQCLSLHLAGMRTDRIVSCMKDSIQEDSEIAAKRLRRARQIENACRKLCYCLYFGEHPGIRYTGHFVGTDSRGLALLELDDLKIRVMVPKDLRVVSGRTYSFMVYSQSEKRANWAVMLKRVESARLGM